MSAPVWWNVILAGLTWWSFILAGMGILGLYVGEKRAKIGWTICIIDEVVWIVYAVLTKQYAFILSALVYAHFYYRRYKLAHEETKVFNSLTKATGNY